MTTPDIVVEADGPMATVVTLHGETEAGRLWLDDNVDPEAPRWCGRVVCEHRYVADVVQGATCDGLAVRVQDTGGTRTWVRG